MVGISAFELTLANNMKLDDVDSASAKRILVPERNGFRTGSLRLDFTRYNTNLEAGGTHPLDTWRDSVAFYLGMEMPTYNDWFFLYIEVGGTPMSGKKNNKSASLSIQAMLSYPTTNIKKEQK